MNIFDKIINRAFKAAVSLGQPAPDFAYRQEVMFNMNPNGWPTPKKSQRVDAQGKTRGDHKRAAREKANAKARAQIAASKKARAARNV